ncbi:MAG: acetyl-CoA carboxylase biotin carboxyl carrier protein [Flavobacteriales bacterium]|nr:acetyl-CoA carboxylase biotin carboxyl carrier protein [Bacteroidota bacterium]MCB9240688.1 acetyl-CoA carboxylase biotin carboxyl carrier protein [Flavobacteriales bacterium]
MNLKEIQQLVKLISTSNVDVLEIEQGDFHLKIKRNDVKQTVVSAPAMAQPMVSAPAPAPAAAPVAEAKPEKAAASEPEAQGVQIKSPMIGTFYRSSSPDKPPFVNVGDEVKVGDTLCIVEAMKLFNEIESEVAGRIVKVLVDDASPVEYDQPLFLIEPA